LMFLEVGKLVILLAGIALLARFGLQASACAVGIAFGVTAIAGVALVVREGPSPGRLLVGFVQPLAACLVMAAAVWGVRCALPDVHPALALAAEIVVGALAYVVGALVLSRDSAGDLLGLLGKALRS